MRSFSILSIIYSLSIIISSCGTNDAKHSEVPTSSISTVEYQTLKSGVLHGAGEEGFSQGIHGVLFFEEYHELKTKMNATNEELEDDLVPDLHFFDEEMLVFVFDKVRGTGGYTFQVNEIIENKERVVVKVLSKRPTGDATSVMTQPYQIVSIPRTEKEITLQIIE